MSRSRRRRRGKSSSNGAAPAAPIVQAEPEEDTGPIAPGRLRGSTVELTLPVRFIEILRWGADARGETVEAFASEILRSSLAGMKSSFRQARTGSAGATIKRADMAKFVGE